MTTSTYRGWTVSYDPPPIPYRGADWRAVHPDSDGELHVVAGSWVELIAEINAAEAELEEVGG